MKIFFLASRAKAMLPTYKKIINVLRANNHNVFDDWLKVTDRDDAVNFEKALKRNMNWIKNANIIVSEISEITSGVSFLIARALELKKPVLALYNSSSKKLPPTTIRATSKSNPLLVFKDYNLKSLEKIIEGYLNHVKNQIDTKFIMIISPQIDQYLDWSSKANRMHKAQVVRKALERMIQEDKEYKKILKKGTK